MRHESNAIYEKEAFNLNGKCIQKKKTKICCTVIIHNTNTFSARAFFHVEQW